MERVLRAENGVNGTNRLAAEHEKHRIESLKVAETSEYPDEREGVNLTSGTIHLYKAGRVVSNKPRSGLVTRRLSDFAVIYSKSYGIAPVKREAFGSNQEFLTTCRPGTWVRAHFAKLLNVDRLRLDCKYMCVEVTSVMEAPIQTRHSCGFTRVKVEFSFDKEHLRYADIDRTNMVAASPIGDVLVPVPVYKLLELGEDPLPGALFWAIHIQETYGCHWMLETDRRLDTFLPTTDIALHHP